VIFEDRPIVAVADDVQVAAVPELQPVARLRDAAVGAQVHGGDVLVDHVAAGRQVDDAARRRGVDRALDRGGVIDVVVGGGAEGADVATGGVAGARPQPDRDRGLARRVGQRQTGRRGAAHRRRPRRDRGQARTRGVDDARGGTRLRGATGGCLVEVGQAVVGGARDVLDAADQRERGDRGDGEGGSEVCADDEWGHAQPVAHARRHDR
jgi:hypothetical protein